MDDKYQFTNVLRGMDPQKQAEFFKKEDAALQSGSATNAQMLRDFTTFDKAFRDQNPNVTPEGDPVYQRAMALNDQVNSAKWAGEANRLRSAFAGIAGGYTGVDPTAMAQVGSGSIAAPEPSPGMGAPPPKSPNIFQPVLDTNSATQALLEKRQPKDMSLGKGSLFEKEQPSLFA